MIKKKEIKVFALIMLVFALFFFVGCGGEQESDESVLDAEESSVIKVGIAISRSGWATKEGDMLLNGYNLWKDYVNEQGGVLVGDQNYTIEIVYYDDQSNPEIGAKVTEKLITEDKVDVMFGPYSSGITQATSVVGEKYGIITMASMASADPVYDRGLKYLFGTLTLASHEVHPFIEMISATYGEDVTLAIITPDSMFPLFAAEGANEKAKSLGMEVVYYEKFPPETEDFFAILTELKRLEPDVIVTLAELGQQIIITKQMKDLDINPRYMWTYALTLPDYQTAMGIDTEYQYGLNYFTESVSYPDPIFGSSSDYIKMFEEAYGYTTSHYEGAAAATGVIYLEAVKRAGTLDAEQVRQVLLDMEGTTLYGRYKFDETGQNYGGTTLVLQMRDQQLRVVWPADVAEIEPVPMPAWKDR